MEFLTENRRIKFERLEAAPSIEEYVQTCVDVPRFLEYCKACGSYGNRWSCPPFREDPMEIWARFQALRLIAYVLPSEPGQSVPQALDNLKLAKARMMEEALELERTIPGSLALSAGTCTMCGENCTRPEGKPCRYPEQMRYSIEALGGDVAKTAERYLHKPLLWIKDNVLPEYLVLVGGLLLKRREE